MNTAEWLPLLALGSLALSLVAVVLCMVSLRRERLTKAELSTKIALLEATLVTANEGAMGLGRRLVGLEQKLRNYATKQDEIGTGGDQFAYSQALQMFDQGADVATVASSCGFSNSEAQLMALVQKQLKPTSKKDNDKTSA